MKIRYNLIGGQSTFKGEIEADENDIKFDHDERTDIYSLTIKDTCIYKTMSKREFKIVNTAIHNLLSGEYTPEDIRPVSYTHLDVYKRQASEYPC